MDLAAGERSFSIVSNQFTALCGQSIERVIDEGVHDVHGLLADTDFGVDLFEDLVDIEREGLNSSFGPSDNGDSSSSGGFGRFSAWHWEFFSKLFILRSRIRTDLQVFMEAKSYLEEILDSHWLSNRIFE